MSKYNKSEYRKEFPYDKSTKSYLKGRLMADRSVREHPLTSTSPKNPPTKKRKSNRPSQRRKQLAPTQPKHQDLVKNLEDTPKKPARRSSPPPAPPKKMKKDTGSTIGTIFSSVIFAVIVLSIFDDAPDIVKGFIVFFFLVRILSALGGQRS